MAVPVQCLRPARDCTRRVLPEREVLQWSLEQLGYYAADIGGNHREQTFDAVHRIQLNVGLGGTGNVASNRWTELQLRLA